jgi:hypothetical protein
MNPDLLLEIIPAGVVALWFLQKLIDAVKVTQYGPAIAEAIKALNDGKITKAEFDAIKAKF